LISVTRTATRLAAGLAALTPALLLGLAGVAAAPVLALSLATNPDVPDLPGITLNGQSRSLNASMNNFAVSLIPLDNSGFNVTVGGDSSAGKSPVFKAYCPGPAACGPDAAAAYVSGGPTLAADSLTLNTGGVSWTQTGVGGSTPSYLCNSGCTIDHATAVKVASAAAALGGLTTWTTSGFSASSIALAVPTTIRRLPQAGEVYHLDLVWTLNTGP
jgi:hypothetical protein